MPELIPLNFFYYREGKDEEKLKELIAPPYDCIAEEELIELKKHPNNISHIILPENYNEAGNKLNEMINNRSLIHNNRRCIVIYGIDYVNPETGKYISRYGFVGLLKLVEIMPANDGVIPHEATFKKFTKDRLKIIQHTDGNFSPIFMIYNGNGTAEKLFEKYIYKRPFLKTIDRDNFTHKIWKVWNEEDIKEFQDIVKNNQFILADGHHRYLTSLRHSKSGGCKYIMALFIDFNDPGLIIYTSHRQIHKISIKNIEELKIKVKKFFKIKKVENFENLKKMMGENKGNHIFGCYFQKTYLFLKLKEEIKSEKYVCGNHSSEWKNLNLPILHEILLKECLKIDKKYVSYIKDVKKGLKNVDDGKIKALFIVNPTTLQEIHEITRLGEIMPQKSTYFYPKPLSGLIIHKHTNKIE
ncbi:MAG: DUF1015 family protein [Promethearchaeota archaeon]